MARYTDDEIRNMSKIMLTIGDEGGMKLRNAGMSD
ncbi:Uncharacterised protein [uncultured Megasphaera sp.]|nr:Uncharacterised protein [uncultured Megasphaera sp.]SCJ62028.1 Uncharacterised protein [uncultured Ruminococcus sp.]